jgi:hypothetical protein
MQPPGGTSCQTTKLFVTAVKESHMSGLFTGGGGPLCLPFAFAFGFGFAFDFACALGCTFGLVFTLALAFDFALALVFPFAFTFAFFFALPFAILVLLSGFIENALCRSGICDLRLRRTHDPA